MDVEHKGYTKQVVSYRGSLLPTLAMLVAMVLWGSSFVAMKYAFFELDPLLVILGRLVIASLCFLPFIRHFVKVPIRKKHLLPMLGMGLCEPCLYFLFEAAALQQTSASQASMISTMLPLLVALAAGMILGEYVSRKTVIGFIVAAAGALWLTVAGERTLHAPNPALGNFLEFLAMVCATGYIILMKYLSRDLPSFFLTAVQCVLGALFFLPVLLLPHVNIPDEISLTGLSIILYLGVFVSVGGYGLYNFGISRIPANQASAFINLIPVFAVFFGFVILGEHFTFWQFLACGVVFCGVIISQDRKSLKKVT